MTTGRINQVAFTCTHGYLANLGKFNQPDGQLGPSIPSSNITGNQCKKTIVENFHATPGGWNYLYSNASHAFTLDRQLFPDAKHRSQTT